MKISSVELKTRLGYYLRTIEQSGEPVEILIRGRAVATLLPCGSVDTQAPPAARPSLLMNRALERSGLRVESASRIGEAPEVRPHPAGDRRTDIRTVELMRQGRDW